MRKDGIDRVKKAKYRSAQEHLGMMLRINGVLVATSHCCARFCQVMAGDCNCNALAQFQMYRPFNSKACVAFQMIQIP